MLSFHFLGAFAAGLIAGSINSVAGGGTMISFPILLALGISPLYANATNTVGLWPGSLGSIWGFREELKRVPKKMLWLIAPALVGATFGAFLLRETAASTFERIVPALLLFATVLFVVAPKVRKRLQVGELQSRSSVGLAIGLQLVVGVYGGYFGAGMSILMLSILSVLGMTDMLEMTAVTSLLSLFINGIAGLIFAFSGLIEWPYALAMAVGAITGGYGAAGLARKVGGLWIRRLVVFVGFSLAAVMSIKILRAP